jgi:hypothetical protein
VVLCGTTSHEFAYSKQDKQVIASIPNQEMMANQSDMSTSSTDRNDQ